MATTRNAAYVLAAKAPRKITIVLSLLWMLSVFIAYYLLKTAEIIRYYGG